MYIVTKQHANSIIVSKRPPYERNDGGRFDLAKCSQKDLKYLYEVLAMTDIVELVVPPRDEKAPNSKTTKK